MSYCELITFSDGKPFEGLEYPNAWGGAARIWTAVFDAYAKDPMKMYHSWISDQNVLWPLAKRKDIPITERAVHASTFDLAYVTNANFGRFANDLQAFVAKYPTKGVDHLCRWATEIEALQVEAIGFYGTSVARNPWYDWDEETERHVPKNLTDGFEVYAWLESLETEQASSSEIDCERCRGGGIDKTETCEGRPTGMFCDCPAGQRMAEDHFENHPDER